MVAAMTVGGAVVPKSASQTRLKKSVQGCVQEHCVQEGCVQDGCVQNRVARACSRSAK